MVDDQRSRLLDATVVSAARIGFARMSVEDIISAAYVSRRTFYELFDNKLDAFLAAFDASAAMLVALVRRGFEGESSFERRVAAGLTAFLTGLSVAPESARVCVVESLAAGPDAIGRRRTVMRTFAEMIAGDDSVPPAAGALPPTTAEALVGGIYEIVFEMLYEGRAARLPQLAPDLTEIVLLPYVGPTAAAEASERLRQVGRTQTSPFAATLPSR